MDSGHAREKPRFAVGCLPLSGDGQPDTFTQTKRIRILDVQDASWRIRPRLRRRVDQQRAHREHPAPRDKAGYRLPPPKARQNYSGVSSHPPPNPARRKPLTTYGQRRISLQMKPER